MAARVSEEAGTGAAGPGATEGTGVEPQIAVFQVFTTGRYIAALVPDLADAGTWEVIGFLMPVKVEGNDRQFWVGFSEEATWGQVVLDPAGDDTPWMLLETSSSEPEEAGRELWKTLLSSREGESGPGHPGSLSAPVAASPS